MTISWIHSFVCPSCGHRSRGVLCQTVRVNKTTLVTTKPGVGFWPAHCRECRAPLADRPDRVALDAESTVKINTYRARKGWPLIKEAA